MRPERGVAATPNITARLSALSLIVGVLLLALVARLWIVQVSSSKQYTNLANGFAVQTVSIPAPRGLIVDRSGNVLASNTATWVVTVNALKLGSSLNTVLKRLAPVVHVPLAQLQHTITAYTGSPLAGVPVAQNVSPQTLFYLAEHQAQFPDVATVEQAVRTYPQGAVAAHILGYVGQVTSNELAQGPYKGINPSTQVGQSGVEASYQSQLAGTPGVERIQVNAMGQPVKVLSKTAPIPGATVQLSLDLSLQKYVAKTLAAQIQHMGAPTTNGAVVVLDPRTGSVLAMASYPTYNPNVWVGGISNAAYQQLVSPAAHYPLINRAIQGLYTPGSTFKVATATAALDSGLITPSTVIYDSGHFVIPGCTAGLCSFHNSGYEALGPLTVTKAIAASDDVFFYNLGYDFWVQRSKYGLTPIQNMAKLYGLGQLSGIPLPGEVKGQVDSPQLRQRQHQQNPAAFPNSGWYAGDNLEMAFGQGETVVTPLQIANAYATFANGGTRWQPRLAVSATSGKSVSTFAPHAIDHVPLPPSTRNAMLQGFIGALTQPYGTAYYTFLGYPFSQYPVAGKTGTATGTGTRPDSLFAMFGPVGNPKYTIAVVVNKAGFGSVGAAPVARKIYLHLMAHPVPSVKPVG